MAYFNYAPVVNNQTGKIISPVNNCAMGPNGMNGHNSPHNVRYSCYNPPFIPISESFSPNSDSLLYSSGKTSLCQVPQSIYSRAPYTYGPSQAASSPANPINNGQVDTSLNCIGTFANRSNCYFNGDNRLSNSANYTSNIQGTCAPFKQYVYNSNKGYHSQYDKKFYKYTDDIEKDYDCDKVPIKTKPAKEPKTKEYVALNVPYDMIPNCQNCFLYAFDKQDVLLPPKDLGQNSNHIREKMKQCFIYDAEMPNGFTAPIAVRKDSPFCAGVFEAVQNKCLSKCTYQ